MALPTATNVPAGSAGAPSPKPPVKNEFSETPFRLAHSSPLATNHDSPDGSVAGRVASSNSVADIGTAARNF